MQPPFASCLPMHMNEPQFSINCFWPVVGQRSSWQGHPCSLKAYAFFCWFTTGPALQLAPEQMAQSAEAWRPIGHAARKRKRMMPVRLIHGPLTGLNSRKLGTILLK